MTATDTPPLVDQLKGGLDAPICLTWELTYACNLACVHCLSSSGRRDPKELTTAEALDVVDQLAAMQVFYVNIGGGEPMLRTDFFEIVEHAVHNGVGVKFSTNGTYLDRAAAERLVELPYLDVQISLDGMTAEVNDAVRGVGSYDKALAAARHLSDVGFPDFKISIVCTRYNVDQLDEFKALADELGAQLRITRLRPSGRGVDSYQDLRLTNDQQIQVFHWIHDHPDVLTGDSFFHLNAIGAETGRGNLPGLNLCGAGRVVCLIDPIGDVYACPFVIHDEFLAGNLRDAGGFGQIWQHSELFTGLREPESAGACASCGSYDACQGGCMATKFFTGLPLDGPDPDCVFGHADEALAALGDVVVPRPSQDHSRPGTVGVALTRKAPVSNSPGV